MLCLLAAATVSAQARQAPTTLSHELLWSFQRVGAPVPSADGKWVVFSVSEPSYDPLKDVSDLWIVPADGSAAPRRLTSTKGTESGPAWSPDSTRIAFAAKRDDDEVNQIYVLDVVRGGEAQRVTAAPTAASVPRWSPDGQKILFQAALWPGATDEESNRKVVQERKNIKSKVRIYDSFPIRDFDHWIEESKSQLWVVDVAGDRKARSLFGASKAAARPGFGGTALGGVWSPDGQSVVFMAAEDEGVAARAAVVTHLWQVPASGGEPKRLTPDGWDFGAPAFRPDGKALCYSVSEAKPVIYQLNRLGCSAWPLSGSSPAAVSIVTKGFDRSLGSWSFAADSQTVYFTAEDSGHERVYAVPAAGGAAKVAVDAPQGVYTNLQTPVRGSSAVAFANWESAIRPAEIVRLDPTTGNRTFLTSFTTKSAESIDWQPLREFWFTGRDGRRIHSFVALPPNFDESKKYPLFVLIHGGHANMWRDSITYRWNYHLLSQPGFVVLLTDYRGSTGYGEKFTLDIQGDPLAGPADDINDAADASDQAVRVHRRQPSGRGWRQLRWPPDQLAGRHDDALSVPGQPRGSRHARDAVGYQRRHLSPRADDGRALLGEPVEMDCAESAREGRQLQDANAPFSRLERLPRPRGQHVDDVLGASADERADTPAHLARREPLDPQGREQPRLLS